ncbi:MBL fold metallo-hydrolase [Rhodococcus marinonascens]|uniref:MBL fold metallo-hydrolase n=1 Tax=Rhodococcus marinonascens TaxID=38311 RepID=UPI0009345620|nr:MBL fold metallo-hydrolase [Rhodococcus marinonascens]
MSVKSLVKTVLATVPLGWLARAAWGLPTQIGASPAKVRPYAAMSPRYRGGQFHNTDPSSTFLPEAETGIVKALITRGKAGRPRKPIPLATPLAPVEAAEVAATWYGHSSVLVEVDGYRVLTDPVWSRRVSPSAILGPSRMHPIPLPLSDLPVLDTIVISHDHYDHLDMATVQQLAATQKALFVVPVGLGAHLRMWRVPEERIVELDWDESTKVGELTLTCTEARHFSGRGLVRNTTQWASWVLAGPSRKVFFGGDSGYTTRFQDLGRRYGPFDLTLLPVGAYDPRWPDIHMNPEEAVQTHTDLEGGEADSGLLMPVHWATFNLAFHAWSEPIIRLIAAAEAKGTPVAVPMPGQRIDVLKPSAQTSWWTSLG